MNINGLLIASNKPQFLKFFIHVKGKVTAFKAEKYTLENIYIVRTECVNKLCIADFTLFMIKGLFDFTILS